VLLLTNYGSWNLLSILGRPIGREIADLMPDHHQEGSCVGIVATDLPLNPLQLQRLTRRVGVGLARTGSVGNDGSGEIFIAFSTANRVPRSSPTQTIQIRTMILRAMNSSGSRELDLPQISCHRRTESSSVDSKAVKFAFDSPAEAGDARFRRLIQRIRLELPQKMSTRSQHMAQPCHQILVNTCEE
jgi:hypothetical protein